jgi:hypothetical protein
MGAIARLAKDTGTLPGTRSRLTSLGIPASLRSSSASFGVLRRGAAHDARARTPIPCPCNVRRAGSVGSFFPEIKRSVASHSGKK